nr:hypothetical protein [Roseobacter cerasinus]
MIWFNIRTTRSDGSETSTSMASPSAALQNASIHSLSAGSPSSVCRWIVPFEHQMPEPSSDALPAAWSLVLALLLWGFLLGFAVDDLTSDGLAFYLASAMILIWSMATSYAALLVLVMFVITKFRG